MKKSLIVFAATFLTAATSFADKLDVKCTWQDREKREVRFVFRVETDASTQGVIAGSYTGKLLPESTSVIENIVFSNLKVEGLMPASTVGQVDWYREITKGGAAVANLSGRYSFTDKNGGSYFVSVMGMLDAEEGMVLKTTRFSGEARVITHYQDSEKNLSDMIMTKMTCTNFTNFDLSEIKLGK